jgi:uncharacterized protein (DUF1330 family)
MERLREGYQSPEYQRLLRLRQEAIDADIVFFERL